jgi:hypothetical protein
LDKSERRDSGITVRTLRSLFLFAATVTAALAQRSGDFEQAPIFYSVTAPDDAVARLRQRMAAKEVVLTGTDNEILRQVLRELKIPVESQIAVYSRTSLQIPLIAPDTPRVIYFSDSVYVSFVPEGFIEAAAIDPKLGPVFYAFAPQDPRETRRTFVREASCLLCHGLSSARGVTGMVGVGGGEHVRDFPTLFARSVITAKDGEPLFRHGPELVSDRLPFERRWGGWYVTGYHGEATHRGNAFGLEKGGVTHFEPAKQRPDTLADAFDTSKYLAATSDIVALLVFQHQLGMQNSLTKAAHTTRRALAAGADASAIIATAADDVVDHLLFREAAPLPAGIKGSEAFRSAFLQNAPRSREGHALKDLSLEGRLFANRCSFLIYSDFFLAMPAELKAAVFQRLHTALYADAPRYAYLEQDEKRRIAEILRQTHAEARQHFEAANR